MGHGASRGAVVEPDAVDADEAGSVLVERPSPVDSTRDEVPRVMRAAAMLGVPGSRAAQERNLANMEDALTALRVLTERPRREDEAGADLLARAGAAAEEARIAYGRNSVLRASEETLQAACRALDAS